MGGWKIHLQGQSCRWIQILILFSNPTWLASKAFAFCQLLLVRRNPPQAVGPESRSLLRLFGSDYVGQPARPPTESRQVAGWSCVGREHCSQGPGTLRTSRTMFRTFLGMFRTCSQDQYAQAQHWLRQAQLMHAQHWPRTQIRTRPGRICPPLPCSHLVPRPMLSMHEPELA